MQTITKAVSTIIHSQSFLRANWWNYGLFVINPRNSTPSSKSGDKTPLQLVEGDDKKVDVSRENLFAFSDLVVVRNPNKGWKFDLKNDIAIYVGHPKGTVNGGLVYYPFVGKVAERPDITKANVSEEKFKQYFASKYETREQSAASKISD